MTVTSRRTCAYCMPVDLLPPAVDLLVQQATACGLPEVFHVSPRSIAIDRARRSSPVVRAICQRSIGSVSTASKRRHMAWCCVCMQVNETGHAQRLNTLKQRPRKWFFREEVDFLSSLIDLQQVQAERFSFPGPFDSWRPSTIRSQVGPGSRLHRGEMASMKKKP